MKLYELQTTFDEMTTQLKELDNCVSPDKNSEQYKMLWDDRAEIRVRMDKLSKKMTTRETILKEFEKTYGEIREDLNNLGYNFDNVMDFLFDNVDEVNK